MGCLFLILLGVSPRLAVVTLWLVTDWVGDAFNDGWILPVLGIVLLRERPQAHQVAGIVAAGQRPRGVKARQQRRAGHAIESGRDRHSATPGRMRATGKCLLRCSHGGRRFVNLSRRDKPQTMKDKPSR